MEETEKKITFWKVCEIDKYDGDELSIEGIFIDQEEAKLFLSYLMSRAEYEFNDAIPWATIPAQYGLYPVDIWPSAINAINEYEEQFGEMVSGEERREAYNAKFWNSATIEKPKSAKPNEELFQALLRRLA